MSAVKKSPYKGTRDFFPPDKRALDYRLRTMKETARSFGYESYNGPLLEEVSLYRAKSGQELVEEQGYSFRDRGGREVAIRPEMTPTLARMVAQIHRTTPLPIRWFSLPNLYRYERPQRGRLREHWQFNVDIFGAPPGMGEVEILQLAVSLMKNFGADESMFEVLVNDRRVVNFLLREGLQLEEGQCQQLYRVMDKYKKLAPEAFQAMLQEVGMNSPQLTKLQRYLALDSFSELASWLQEAGGEQVGGELLRVEQLAQELGFARYLRYDPSIVRGIDYYTGIVFEVFDRHPDNRRALCGGGAYANLLQVFDESPLPGVGFGLGDVTLQDFLNAHHLAKDFSTNNVDLYLAAQVPEALPQILQLAAALRECGCQVLAELAPLKFKKAWSHGEKQGARFLGFMDERELAGGQVQIKECKSKRASAFSLAQVEPIVQLLQGGDRG